MMIKLNVKKENDVTKTNDEMEHALYHLMYQFRQINSKYGLMIKGEIKDLYNRRLDSISCSKEYLEEIKERERLFQGKENGDI